MYHRPVRLLALLPFVLIAFALAACDSGGSDSASGTGTVGILFTDGPTDEFAEINIVVKEIRLLSEAGQVTVFSGPPYKRFNLLSLRYHADLLTVAPDVPAGIYTKIRLIVASITLVDWEGTETDVRLPANGKLDLNPRGEFNVVAGATLLVQIDIDANKSVHLHEAGQTGSDRWILRPVIFVRIVDGLEAPQRLARISGVIQRIGADAMLVCRDNIEGHWSGCIRVNITPDTSVFNEEGDQVRPSELATGQSVTVVGRLRGTAGDDVEVQPLTHDTSTDVAMDAEVVEIGRFAQFNGRIASDGVNEGKFDLALTPGQGISSDTPVSVQMQPGTKIFNRQGELLDSDAITLGREAMAEGVLALSTPDPDFIKAALVVLGRELEQSKLAGVISADLMADTFMLMADVERCVRIDRATRILRVDDDASMPGSPADLVTGQIVDVYGNEGAGGCFDAEDIIVFVSAGG